MRVLLVPASYPPVLGGLQSVAHTLACRLKQNGHHIRVFTNRYPRTLAKQERMDSVQVDRRLFLWPTVDHVYRRRADLFLASLYYGPTTLIALFQRIHQFRPDVVNVHFAHSQIPFVLWLHRFFEFRLVVSLHGDDVERWIKYGSNGERLIPNDSRARRRRFEELLRQADAVTTCSSYLLQLTCTIEPSVASKGIVIHNGIDPSTFRNRMRWEHPCPYVFAYGRLTHKKGFDVLLDAFANIVDEHDNLDLLLAGEGEEHEQLGERIRDNDLSSRARLLGRVSSSEVVQLLNGASAVVIPSRREPFGITALEALAAGAPVVATAVGGLTEFVTPDEQELTRLVPPTVEGLTSGMRETLDAVSDTEGPPYPPREDVLRQYAWSTMVTRYERVLAGETRGEEI